MMRAFVAFVAAVALIGSAAAQDLTSGSANAPELVVARTMVTAKIVPTPKPEPIAPVAAVKKAPVPAPSKVAAKSAKKDVKKPKLPPGAASAAAKAALPKAPKDELIKWVRATLPGEPTEAELHKIHLYLNGQLLHTFEDLIKLGEDGIKALIVSDKLRALFLDKLIAYIGKTRGVDDGLLVPTAPLRKAVHKKKCTKRAAEASEPRFMSIAVNPKAPKPLADWLRRAFPDTKPLRMSRTLLALERQTIKSFDDLQRIGVKGVAKLLYVPDGIRGALRDAIIHHIGVTGGHDDGKPVTARHYVPPKPVHHDDCE